MLKQVVSKHGYIYRPISATPPRWYLDKKMKDLNNIPAAPNVPDWIVAKREDINDDMLAKLGIDDEPKEDFDDSEFEEEFEEDITEN